MNNKRLKFKLFSFPRHYILVSWQNLRFFQAARATPGVARIFKTSMLRALLHAVPSTQPPDMKF